MKNLCLLLFAFLPIAIFGQTLSGNVDYPELGISFTIPTGWVGQESENAVIMGSNTVAGYLIIMTNGAANLQQLIQEAKMGLNDQGVSLQLQGEVKTVSQTQIEATYQGSFNYETAKCFGTAKIDGKGKGVTVLALTSVEAFGESQINAARQLMRSVRFTQAKASQLSVAWQQKIGGRRLVYMNTSGGSDYGGGYSGSSTRINIDLCTSGRFNYYFNSQSSFDSSGGFGYAHGNDSNTGTWKVMSSQSGSALILSYDNGEVSEFSLSENAEGHLLLNNTRYLRTNVEGCY
ncbi:MAG: hypothetical protein AAFO94_02125 [Bacteroidota bacterium]